jgi:hypothetical protein
VLSSHGEILWESENCVDNSKYNPGASVELIPCHGMEGNQKWIHDKKSVSISYFMQVLIKLFQALIESHRESPQACNKRLNKHKTFCCNIKSSGLCKHSRTALNTFLSHLGHN